MVRDIALVEQVGFPPVLVARMLISRFSPLPRGVGRTSPAEDDVARVAEARAKALAEVGDQLADGVTVAS